MSDTGDSDLFLVQIGAFTSRGSEEFFCDRLINHSHHQLSILLKSNRDRKARVAMGKIGGAIERIDDPAMAPVALLSASLFRHDSVLGEVEIGRASCRERGGVRRGAQG